MVQKNSFLESVVRDIDRQQLLAPEDKVLVALSGGADSVALLLVLQQAGFHCEAAHCNFHLRGEESERDEKFVRALCRSRSVRLYVQTFDTAGYARSHGISLEMAARDLRYAYFDELRRDFGFDKIAVAHHREDNVETMLLNLVRGTGLKGLTGMRPANGAVVRPLLERSREEIEDYLAKESQTYVTDSTNLQPMCERNKVRLALMPLLKDLNPGVDDTLQATIHRLADAYTLYNIALENLKAQLCRQGRISIPALKETPASRTVLYELLSDYGFNPSQAEDVFENLDGEPGRVYESKEWRLLRDRGQLVFSRKGAPYRCLCPVLPLEGIVQVAPDMTFSISRLHCDESFELPRTKDTVCLDLEKLEFPITVRLVEEGDRFVPFGMKGTKLVSDYLTDAKKNVFEKERQMVVCSGNHIAWLVGERADDRFRVDESTTRVLLIQCQLKG